MELNGSDDWEEFSSFRNSMDFNNDSCDWKGYPSYYPYGNWTITGSDYQIPE